MKSFLFRIPILSFLLINSINLFYPINTIGLLFLNVALFIFYIVFPFNKDINKSADLDIKNEEINTEIESSTEDIVYLDPRGENRPETCHNCTEQIYFIHESIPIIKDLINNTLENEEEIIKGLFKNFEEISNESDAIVEESEKSMNSIFHSDDDNNLTYILDSSKKITKDFSAFLSVINEMARATDNFVATSFKSFDAITNMTKEIIDLSEQVHLISINVRIESARIKDSGGFKVLGKDISDFSEKTSKVARTTNDKIKNAIMDIEIQKNELSTKIENVENTAKEIFTKVSPFEGIIKTTSDSILDIIKNFNNVSNSLQGNLQKSITKLQYQDITSQEITHIIQIFERINHSGLLDRDYSLYLTEEKKMSIKLDILNFLKEISTTITEENEITSISKDWGIPVIEEAKVDSEEISPDIFLF